MYSKRKAVIEILRFVSRSACNPEKTQALTSRLRVRTHDSPAFHTAGAGDVKMRCRFHVARQLKGIFGHGMHVWDPRTADSRTTGRAFLWPPTGQSAATDVTPRVRILDGSTLGFSGGVPSVSLPAPVGKIFRTSLSNLRLWDQESCALLTQPAGSERVTDSGWKERQGWSAKQEKGNRVLKWPCS